MFYNIINDYIETIIAIKSSYTDIFVVLTYFKHIKKFSTRYIKKEFFKEYFTPTTDYFYTEDYNLEVFVKEKEKIEKEIKEELKIQLFYVTEEIKNKATKEIIEILNFIFEEKNREIDIHT